MPTLRRPFLKRGLDIGQCHAACFQQHQQMVEKVGRLGGEPIVVLLHGCQTGFDGLLAKLFGTMGYALFDQGARVGFRCARLGALVNPFFQVGQRELAHGFGFYFLTWLILPSHSLLARFTVAVGCECVWEIIENTPFIIERYRAGTISLQYYGDSIINSLSDTVAMISGFVLARALPISVIVGLAATMELVVGYLIRDNLTLNILMLVYPVDAIRTWQAGG